MWPMGSDPQSYLQFMHETEHAECLVIIDRLQRERDRFELALYRLRMGVDTAEMHCEPVPTGSSWRYVIDAALGGK